MKRTGIHLTTLLFLFAASLTVRILLYENISSLKGGEEFAREGALFSWFSRNIEREGTSGSKDASILTGSRPVEYDKVFSLFSVRVLTALKKRVSPHSSFERFSAFCGHVLFSFVPVLVYLLIFVITESYVASFLGAFFSSFSRAALLRTLAIDYTKEIYAVPFMVLCLFFTGLLLKREFSLKKRMLILVLTGISAGLALLIWDMTRVFLALSAVTLLVLSLSGEQRRELRQLAAALLAFPLLLSLTNPYLMAHRYYLFPLNALLPALAAAALFSGKRALRGSIFFVVLFSCFLGLLKYNRDYSHFFDLFFYKLKFLNIKPLDSAKLPYEVRLLWTPALHSVNAKIFAEFYLGLAILSLPGFIAALRGRWGSAGRYGSLTGLVFFLLSMFFFRFLVFSAVFLPLAAGFSMAHAWRLGRSWRAAAFSLLAFCVAGYESGRVFAPDFIRKYAENFPYKDTRSLTEWERTYTRKGSVFLGNFVLTPSLLSYGGRSVVTHPKYEDAGSRRIIEEYIQALFGADEESFRIFCLENKVDYFVFSKGTFNDTSLYSLRYIAGCEKAPDESLKGCAAFRFERDPLRLKYFGVCFENEKYRVLRLISDEGMQRSSELFKKALALFREDGKSLEGVRTLYQAYLENPQNLAVRILLKGKQKSFGNTYFLPYAY